MTGQVVEFIGEARVGRALGELIAQMRPDSQRMRRRCGTISATGSPCTVRVTGTPALTASTT
ncbi:hypothetical protein L758_03545 [Mycobacterium tuberculosis TRS1]|uniref:Uncharacterized protein n=1 Tax=Mycobacterium tuberculosis TaxID=1773 RepID=A0A916PCR4_MYCTX|nr:hypothetical protein [Mycobacterium canetti]AGL30102.1 hypothetical protein J114_03545 [Mycobacterium tuberculosis EAI5/NITR206]AID03737.1 hypothetical protein ER17_03485 [Mycobacterium tuberculosis]AQN81515.1 hypothetical protein L766_03545 [Mycobacterium tuberculosis TRS9]AQN85386.1 hypothetical protein L787_03525 [Mycobacterium tuberculosis 1821ADB35]AQN89278.1 hypothetical protein L789_03525 [Mycobacterium tuberculosis 1821ADB37]AQN93167.1 hypothetical protein L790_03525 [Mycobacterium